MSKLFWIRRLDYNAGDMPYVFIFSVFFLYLYLLTCTHTPSNFILNVFSHIETDLLQPEIQPNLRENCQMYALFELEIPQKCAFPS